MKRELQPGDILLINDAFMNGEPLGPRYFLVTKFCENRDEFFLTPNEGYRYNAECLLMGVYGVDDTYRKLGRTYSRKNFHLKRENIVWYTDTEMPNEDTQNRSLVKTDRMFYFIVQSMDFTHCGELSSQNNPLERINADVKRNIEWQNVMDYIWSSARQSISKGEMNPMTFIIEQSGGDPMKLTFETAEDFLRQLYAMIRNAKMRGRTDFRIEVY